MSEEKAVNVSDPNSKIIPFEQENERPALVKKIGKTTYQVRIHFSTTSLETMSDKIKRMLRNEISRM